MKRRNFLRKFGIVSAGIVGFPAIVRADPLTLSDPAFIDEVGSSGAAAGLKAGLISYWNLDETVAGPRADSQGAHALADKTSALTGAAGILNNCVFHVGQTSSRTAGLKVATTADFESGSGKSFTMTGWYFVVGNNNNGSGSGKWGSTTATKEYLLFSDVTAADPVNCYFQAQFMENGTTVKTCVPGASDSFFQQFNSTWNFFAFGYDATNQVGFISRVKSVPPVTVSTITIACTNINSGAADFVVGNNSAYNLGWWGNVDEVGYWSRRLTNAELIQLFNNGTPLAYSSF